MIDMGTEIQIGCEGCCVNIKLDCEELPIKLRRFLEKHRYDNIIFIKEDDED